MDTEIWTCWRLGDTGILQMLQCLLPPLGGGVAQRSGSWSDTIIREIIKEMQITWNGLLFLVDICAAVHMQPGEHSSCTLIKVNTHHIKAFVFLLPESFQNQLCG